MTGETGLAGRVVLITGGASGLGAATARAAAAAGARLALVDRDAEGAAAIAARHEGAASFPADVAEPGAMEAACAAVVARFGGLDAAVNCAGILSPRASLPETRLEDWSQGIAVNLTGVFLSLKAEIPHILARGGGAIVNIASMAGLVGEAKLGAYVAAKHGVVGLTKSAALDHALQGLRCNAVCPTYVRTPMTEASIPDLALWDKLGAGLPMGRTVTPEEVAATVLFLLGGGSGGITGAAIPVDAGGLAR